MALEACFQVITIITTSTPTTTKSSYLQPHHKEKLCVRSKRSTPSLSTSSTSSLRSFGRSDGRFVCEAKNAVDGVPTVPAVDDASWDSLVLGNSIPVIVDFWAPWCGPCRMIAPIIDELAKEYAGKIDCYKVNTDDCPNIAGKYGIRSIPTVLFFKNGEKKESVIGAVPKSTLKAAVEKYI